MVGRSTKKNTTLSSKKNTRENSESQEIEQERNNSQDKHGESPIAQNKSSFNNEADLVDQTSSPTIFKRTNIIDRKAKTPISQEPAEIKEMQDKGSWKTVEKKKESHNINLTKKDEEPDN